MPREEVSRLSLQLGHSFTTEQCNRLGKALTFKAIVKKMIHVLTLEPMSRPVSYMSASVCSVSRMKVRTSPMYEDFTKASKVSILSLVAF